MNRIIRTALVASCAVFPALAQDTVRVRADNPPVWGATVRLVKEAAVGTLTDPAENASGSIGSVASLPSGVFFVYDSKDTVIRRYDASGKFTGKVGRSGAGPGEYRTVNTMATLGDTALVICDAGNGRITFFSSAGKLLNSFPKPPGSSSGCTVFAETTGLLRVMQTSIWYRYRQNGTLVDSGAIRAQTVHKQFALMTSDGARPSFGDDWQVAPYTGGGTITMWPRPYRIAVPQANGKVLLIERAYRPIPIVGEERAQWQARADQFNARPPSRNTAPGLVYGPYAIPDTKPGLRDVTSDDLGRLWVDVYTNATKREIPPPPPPPPGRAAPPPSLPLTWREASAYDVIDAAGKFLGRVELPPQAQLESIQRNRIWLRTKGPDGEDLITAYRIQGTGGP